MLETNFWGMNTTNVVLARIISGGEITWIESTFPVIFPFFSNECQIQKRTNSFRHFFIPFQYFFAFPFIIHVGKL